MISVYACAVASILLLLTVCCIELNVLHHNFTYHAHIVRLVVHGARHRTLLNSVSLFCHIAVVHCILTVQILMYSVRRLYAHAAARSRSPKSRPRFCDAQ